MKHAKGQSLAQCSEIALTQACACRDLRSVREMIPADRPKLTGYTSASWYPCACISA
jgi:hypothetical protein